LLQTYYDIDLEKRKVSSEKPDLTKIRKVIFWDADIEKINWKKQSKSVIQRIFERGNSKEKEEIIRFYGNEIVQKVIGNKFESI
jgi:antitoxin HigA-1